MRTAAAGLIVQFALAALLIKVPGSQIVFEWIGDGVDALVRSTEAGTTLVFGYLGGGATAVRGVVPGCGVRLRLPLAPAGHLHRRVVGCALSLPGAAADRARLRLCPEQDAATSAERPAFSTAANVFLGMVEAPLLVRPYLQTMSRSDLFIVMTGGMATIAGTVYVLFSVILDGIIPDPAGHLLTASIISAPAAVVIALILIPRGDDSVDETKVEFAQLYDNGIDALTRGAIDGLRLLAYIIGMLIVFVALVGLANIILGAFPDVDGAELTLQRLFGWALAPVVWVLGIPWSDAVDAGQLLGTKVVLNELVAYIDMSNLPDGALSEKSALIMAYAICGFANFGSVGIMLGGLAAIVPERRGELAQLGLKSIMAGTMATCMTGAIAGLLFW